ncbi:fas-associated death domain protein [Rhynchophorus ferrugineus]|uniref:fas-associated death domain protein n=1 Tax=Rhynchophorus ferrugineus TaxID=354439 RepID=UPI003FCDD50A
MVLSVTEYTKICTELCNEITRSQLEMLKNHFRLKINSRRTLSRIDTARGLFRLLEKRDLLCPENETTLNEIRCLVKPNNFKTQETIQHPIDNRLHSTRVLPSVPRSLIEKVNTVIRSEIGAKWKEFARALSITEGYIDRLESQHRGNISDMVQEILTFEHERDFPNMDLWQIRLKHALEEARRKDLSRRIDNILILNSI